MKGADMLYEQIEELAKLRTTVEQRRISRKDALDMFTTINTMSGKATFVRAAFVRHLNKYLPPTGS